MSDRLPDSKWTRKVNNHNSQEVFQRPLEYMEDTTLLREMPKL